MLNIIFVCHGNICRSPAAEFIMKDLLRKYHLDNDVSVCSRATSLEEIGNDIYPPMKSELYRNNIPFERHHASRITQKDYDSSNYIFYMDDNNLRYLNCLLNDNENKLINITKYSSNHISHIEDPWYSDRFDLVVSQLIDCCKNIIEKLIRAK